MSGLIHTNTGKCDWSLRPRLFLHFLCWFYFNTVFNTVTKYTSLLSNQIIIVKFSRNLWWYLWKSMKVITITHLGNSITLLGIEVCYCHCNRRALKYVQQGCNLFVGKAFAYLHRATECVWQCVCVWVYVKEARSLCMRERARERNCPFRTTAALIVIA